MCNFLRYKSVANLCNLRLVHKWQKINKFNRAIVLVEIWLEINMLHEDTETDKTIFGEVLESSHTSLGRMANLVDDMPSKRLLCFTLVHLNPQMT